MKWRGVRSGLAAVLALGSSVATVGCGGADAGLLADELGEASDDAAAFDTETTADEPIADDGSLELGTAQQELFFFDPFNFVSSCSDRNGTNSVMAALAVATATELKRWQPTKDFVSSSGMLKLTATGKAQCADGRCWNTQAILDLQSAPAGSVQVRPGVLLDSKALKSSLTTNLALQLFSLISMLVPDHKFQLVNSEPGGCDQFYWFNVTSPTGGVVSSLLTSTLKQKLTWVGGDSNPYIQFQTDGTMVGIDPTYGLNQAGATSSGTCAAACTKVSSSDITGSCCSCNGTKKYSRSAWNATTYICQ
jgi:hypothetical protein